MAKSARASSTKRNRAQLRGTVFNPVVEARTERLSEKLKELATRPNEDGKQSMELDNAGSSKLLFSTSFTSQGASSKPPM